MNYVQKQNDAIAEAEVIIGKGPRKAQTETDMLGEASEALRASDSPMCHLIEYAPLIMLFTPVIARVLLTGFMRGLLGIYLPTFSQFLSTIRRGDRGVDHSSLPFLSLRERLPFDSASQNIVK